MVFLMDSCFGSEKRIGAARLRKSTLAAGLLLLPLVASASEEAPTFIESIFLNLNITYVVATAATLLNVLFSLILFFRARYSFERTKMRDMLLITKLPIQIGAVDELGKILYWQNENSKVRNVSPPSELKDLPFELLREIRPCIQRVFSTRKKVVHKYGFFGRYRQLEFFMLPAHVFGKRAVMWFSSDITKLHNAMDSTAHLAQSSQLILESIVDAVVVTDCDGKIVQINPAAAALLGCNEADVVSKSAETIFHFRNGEDDSQGFNPIDSVLRNGVSESLPPAAVMICKNGREYNITGNVSVMFDGTAVISGAVLCFRDITDLMNRQQQLTDMMDIAQSASRAKGRFIDALNHELRLPLNAVIGSAELLQSDNLSHEDRRKYLEDINSAGKNMLNLINELLNVSKLDADDNSLRLDRTDIGAMVADLGWVMRDDSLGLPSAKLALQSASPIPLLRMDSDRLRQMLIYLMSCIKRWRRSASIVFRAEYSGVGEGVGCVVMSIEGMASVGDEGSAERADQFFQNSMRSKVGLSNISLDFMLAQRISQVIGGKIDLISDTESEIVLRVTLEGVETMGGEATVVPLEAPAVTPRKANAGASAKADLPVAAEPAKAASAASPIEAAAPAHRPASDYIMVVDDNEVNLKVAAAMLKKMKIRSVSCSSPENALEEIAKNPPMAVLVDLWMPGLSGDDFARRMRGNSATAGIPMAVMTADTTISPEKEALFNQTLFKPITSSTLKACIETLLPELKNG